MADQFVIYNLGYVVDGQPERVVIPDGKWVAQMHEESWNCWRDTPPPGVFGKFKKEIKVDKDLIVGIDLSEKGAKRYLVHNHHGEIGGGSHISRDYLVVSDKPFGIVHISKDVDEKWGRFHPARQIHKGELGRKPGVSKPRFAQKIRQAGQSAESWCRLAELAEIMGMESRNVLGSYFSFAPIMKDANPYLSLSALVANDESELFEDDKVMTMVLQSPERVGSVEDDDEFLLSLRLRKRYPQFAERRRQHFVRSWQDSRLEFEKLWVRASWAMTALYLHQFGYVEHAV